jgi:hypothetical protein
MGGIFKAAPGYESFLSACGLGGLDAVFRWEQGDRLDKPGLEPWRQRWRIALGGPGEGAATYYLKRFSRPPLFRQVGRWRNGGWRLSTAGLEFENARALAEAGIAAADAVAFGQEMAGPWERRSFVLLREVAGVSLERWLPNHVPPPTQEADWRGRRDRVDGLARFVAAFHEAGFVHRDLYLSHVFIQPLPDSRERVKGQVAADGGAVSAGPVRDLFRLIDLQRVFRPRWRQRRWVVKDLAALNYSTPADRVSLQERLRFLCRYTRLCRRFGSARQLSGLVQAKTAWMTRRRRPKAGKTLTKGTATVR